MQDDGGMTGTQIIPVYIVVPPHILLLDVAGPAEVLRRANVEQTEIRFDLHYVSSNLQQVSSVGLTLAGLEPLPDTVPDNAYIIVCGIIDTPDGTVDPLPEHMAISTWLRNIYRQGMGLITICSGALLAGRAGLFDGYQCTTHALSVAELRTIAPAAQVHENRLFVEDKGRYSSAGISTGTDLLLHVVAKLTTPVVALNIARYMVVYMRRTGAEPQISPWLSGRNHIHPSIHRLQDAIIADPARNWTLSELADTARMSMRNLTRLFQEQTGHTVGAYVNLIRVTLAKDILTNSELDMENIAQRTGFASARHLRRVWSKYNDMPPSDYRKKTAVY